MFLSFLLWGCSEKGIDSSVENDSAVALAPELEWSIIDENVEQGALMSIWEAAATDIWIVGGQAEQGVVFRGSGVNWNKFAVPEDTPLLNWVYGLSETDVWVVGLAGTILHWNGTAWQDYSVEMEEALWGVYATPETVVCVGGESRWGGSKAKFLVLEEGRFVEKVLPTELGNLGNLFKIGFWNDQFWAIGQAGALIRWDGSTELAAIPTGIMTDFVTINNNVIVGGRGTGVLTTLEGQGITEIQQFPAGLNGIDQESMEKNIVVGERGYSAIVNMSEKTITEIDSVTLDILHAALISSTGDIYAVGGNLFTADDYFHGIILQLED